MPNPLEALLDQVNSVGSNIRYGVDPAEKYKMLVSQSVPGMPKPFIGGDVNPEAERYLSNFLGAQKWGAGPPDLFNKIRYLIDNNPEAFAAGLKGAEAGASPLETMMASMSR